ncbi:MAG: spore germination protein [Clostridiales bacterium]|nr:spore germination protein [Clostridiales bacterium]
MEEKLLKNLDENLKILKELLPAQDVLTYSFETKDGVACAVIYADGMVNKQLLGELVARPLTKITLNIKQNDGGRYETNEVQAELQEFIKTTLLFPELKDGTEFSKLTDEILDGNSLLLVDGLDTGFIIGAKLLPVRSISEPPSDVAIKGPREGFIEDIKTNMTLVRKRLKCPELRFETLKIGKRSNTHVAISYLDGISSQETLQKIKEQLQKINVDCIVDSSYIAGFLAPRKHSVFKQVGSTEKPDVFCAKIAEGRVGILVDGSPIALTLPFILTEDLQSSEDYFISPFMASVYRGIRLTALFVALLLPALYVTAQIFKMQLLPLGLMLTIAGSVQGLPLSPSLEIFVVLLLLEILKEASIRMPKYVGMSLSVVGALVLGEAAVSAGFLSTPAIIVVAVSGICLYTVPNFVETGSILRWIFLLVAGSVGVFGIVLFVAFLLYYLVGADGFGTPLLSPFSPLTTQDLKDTIIKYPLEELPKRPNVFRSKNKTRYRPNKTDSKGQEQ